MPYTTNSDRVAETVNEFCAALGIGRSLFYKEVGKGRIKILKAGSRKTLVPISEREAYLQRLTEEAAR
ncbi:DNA binding domain protein, excisionase family (fragment) [uncultured Alphaproteobacteria bacterium]|uniref:DNA binding domain protein, excisionase family n=1 Tax=uncultured Alphaproteobacteria bacterium TaxID=91750 RepID=A0A212JZK3_9PROT